MIRFSWKCGATPGRFIRSRLPLAVLAPKKSVVTIHDASFWNIPTFTNRPIAPDKTKHSSILVNARKPSSPRPNTQSPNSPPLTHEHRGHSARRADRWAANPPTLPTLREGMNSMKYRPSLKVRGGRRVMIP